MRALFYVSDGPCTGIIRRHIIIFYFRWDQWAHCGFFDDGVLLLYTLEGVSSVAYFITAYKESQENRDSHFLVCDVFFVSKDNLFDVYLSKVSTVNCELKSVRFAFLFPAS